MMMSSGLQQLASASTVASVISPAGSITQTVRGFSSLPTNSSSAPARRALAGERRDRLRVPVVDDAVMARAHQPADDVAAHPAEADHAELHLPLLSSSASAIAASSVFSARCEIALEMHAQRAPAALGQHVEIAARLRRLDDAEARLLAGHLEVLLRHRAVICRKTPLSGPPL